MTRKGAKNLLGCGVAIVLLIATMRWAEENIARSRLQANESAVVRVLRSTVEAQNAYRERALARGANGEALFAADFGSLASVSPVFSIVHPVEARFRLHGYVFGMARSSTKPDARWIVTAEPIAPRSRYPVNIHGEPGGDWATGEHSYAANETGSVFQSLGETPFALAPDGEIPASARVLTPR